MLTGDTLRENLRTLESFRGSATLVELRADFLAAGERRGIPHFAVRCPLPVILTVRRTRDGGHFAAPENERVGLLRHGLRGPFGYVDLENDLAPDAVAVPRHTRVIRSFHQVSATPHDLAMQAAACARDPTEIPKVAVRPNCVADLLRLVALGQSLRRPHIVIAIGEYGVATRLLAQRLGSMLTFSSPPTRAGADGHLTPHEMTRVFGVPRVSDATVVNAIAGFPVAHSRSPRIHNAGYRASGLDAIYVPLHGERLEPLLSCAERLGVTGLSVTVPHKEAAARAASVRDDSVASTGACNTLVQTEQGWHGYNTDVEGFLAPLLRRGLLDKATRRSRAAAALVVGAGGAARAAVYALTRAGIRVLIAGRTLERATRLAATSGADAVTLSADDLAARAAPYLRLVIQASSAGMAPQQGVDPIAAIPLTGKETVYDMVYAPDETALLARARAAGCATIGGMEMLLAQAFAQYRLFTGGRYPVAALAELGLAEVGERLLEA